MDVNETLKRIRVALSDMRIAHDSDSYAAVANDLAVAVQDLDEWLSKGGCPPEAWITGLPLPAMEG